MILAHTIPPISHMICASVLIVVLAFGFGFWIYKMQKAGMIEGDA